MRMCAGRGRLDRMVVAWFPEAIKPVLLPVAIPVLLKRLHLGVWSDLETAEGKDGSPN